MIKWIFGNTLPIVVELKEVIKTQEGTTTEDYIPPVGSDIEVWAIGECKKKQFDYTIDGNVLMFTDDGTLNVGTYGIRITVIEPESRRLRSFKCEELKIVNCTEDLDLGEFIQEGAVTLDAMPFFWAKGEKGDQGIQGVQGEKGERGEQGEQGVKGDTGNGISSVTLNANYTLTLNFTDGTSYTTPSIRGEKGEKGNKGDAGTTDYNDLENKPDLSIYMQEVTQEQFDNIFN